MITHHDDLEEAWQNVPCPTCKAKTNQRCVTVSGLEMRLNHRDRKRNYRRRILRNADIRAARF
jgi:hypothetical protein